MHHIGFSNPCPTFGERVRMALAEVGATHLTVEDHGPDNWVCADAYNPGDGDLLWRAREIADAEPLCRRHFDGPASVARLRCVAHRPLTLDCGGT